MIDPAYARLGAVIISADLRVRTPSGGSITVRTAADGQLRIDCDSTASLSDGFELFRRLGWIDVSYRSAQHLRNPLQQGVEVTVGDTPLLSWQPGKFPKVRSFGKLISFLKHLRS